MKSKLLSKPGLMLSSLTLAAWLITALTPAVAQSVSSKTRVTTSSSTSAKVDVNTADAQTLETLPGVGPSIAQKIVAGRPYNSLQDLEKVKGLSAAKVEAMKNQVAFGPGATAKTTTRTDRSFTATKPGVTETHSGPLAATGRLSNGEKININTASAEELDRLPGIGKSKAQAIVTYRNQNGRFNSIEDIEKVKGIKEGEFAKIKDSIKVQ
jgi:competence protein ComEA